MKGISTILAMILIVIIVVALIGLTYTFAVGLFSTTSTTATTQVEETTKRLDKHISFVGTEICRNLTAAGPTSSWTVQFTIRHDGATYEINTPTTSELTAIVDSAIIADTSTYLVGGSTRLGTTPISPGTLKTFNLTFTNGTSGISTTTSHKLTISTPAGEMPVNIACTTA